MLFSFSDSRVVGCIEVNLTLRTRHTRRPTKVLAFSSAVVGAPMRRIMTIYRDHGDASVRFAPTYSFKKETRY
ncbi:hypothetical protein CCR75_002993 [Bremia lactucae]|uniref:Uncharacterized protein n=1 Tax=Bremia lactucae TaxID=4779 RepID=A0A976FER0_BRELC|nr:hypothetical protein CCR75_002993 [Bremia lactucae]